MHLFLPRSRSGKALLQRPGKPQKHQAHGKAEPGNILDFRPPKLFQSIP